MQQQRLPLESMIMVTTGHDDLAPSPYQRIGARGELSLCCHLLLKGRNLSRESAIRSLTQFRNTNSLMARFTPVNDAVTLMLQLVIMSLFLFILGCFHTKGQFSLFIKL